MLFKLDDCASIFACPSHIHKHKFQTSIITFVATPTILHWCPLRFLFLQHYQFTVESVKLCNNVLEVSVMDGCYCLSMPVTSFHFGAVCCTVLFLILCNFVSCLVSCTPRDLVKHGILYSAGSCPALCHLVQRADSWHIAPAQNKKINNNSNNWSSLFQQQRMSKMWPWQSGITFHT